MKKIAVLGMIIMTTGAYAGFVDAGPKGGFVSGNETIVTVEQVMDMRDDADVIVVGKISKSLGDDKYKFEDETGTITVEIDEDDWRGQTVTPSDKVKIIGEVDSGIFKTEIDVDRIEKM